MRINKRWYIGGREFGITLHKLWALCHLVHYSGQMHTYWIGPFAFIYAKWEEPK